MGKSPSSAEKIGVKKGPWTPEEDQKLIDFIQKYGHGKWRALPKNAGLKRCGKSCRLRWKNYLRPDIKRGRFSFEEEEIIINLHSVLGNKWSTIAASLPGRTDNEIKNYWNTHIKKKLLKMGIDPVTHTPCLDLLQLSSTLMNSSFYNNPTQLNHPGLVGMENMVNPNLITLLAALLPSHSQNPYVTHQNLQQTLIGESTLLQNQLHNSGQYFQPYKPQIPVQENQISNKATLEQIFPISDTNFSCQNTLPNLWQYNDGAESAMQSLSSSPNKFNNIWENQIVHNNLVSLVLSTPSSSSPTTLNSPSSTAEGVERDTYCRNILV